MTLFPTIIVLLTVGTLLSYSALADDVSGSSTCVFDDGREYQAGESVGNSFPTRCGDPSEWPCFCEPQLTFQAFCPYCGFSDGAGTLYCARDGETITFTDGSIVRVCSCAFDPADPTEQPMRNCTTGNSPVESPSTGAPVESPSTGAPVLSGQCVLPDAEGDLVEIDNGESFGDLIQGACGPASQWPSFCRVLDDQGDFDFLYPYCVFNDVNSEEGNDGPLCAMDGEVISYIDENNVQQTCNCTISQDGLAQPECEDGGPVSSPTTSAPSGVPDIQSTPAPTLSASGVLSVPSCRWTIVTLPLLILGQLLLG
ncbi:hypothetical protein IV203_029594 [Nitzschia inconspicua]|uniref:Uncharacterized protein n=1 Tax=Nitzschia inconspicua TaxID=303405 RepID=A0A9K3LS57_9STRA|nr:hypothetical protein IV203_029594 [Nitzschia inconspicua]